MQETNQRQDMLQQQNPVENVFEMMIRIILFLLVLATFPLTLGECLIVVREYERGVVLSLGRIKSRKPKPPGIHFILPCLDEFRVIDMRTRTFDVPPQQIITNDSVSVLVDAVVFWRVFDATKKVAVAENAEGNTVLLAQSSLRNILGTKTLAQILTDKEEISHSVQGILDEATDVWGIKVEKVEIKDIKLPPQLQRAMATEAETTREAKARVITAEGEMNASKKLKEAADIMNFSPNAIQLRYLQTLNTISGKNNHTIIMPIPASVIRALMGNRLSKQRRSTLTSKL